MLRGVLALAWASSARGKTPAVRAGGRGQVPAGDGQGTSSEGEKPVVSVPGPWGSALGEGRGRDWGQCRPCWIQFLMVHFCPEHLCITSRSPKWASLDISTSRHLPVSRLTMGPLFREGN